jgi:DHA2 family lincomycin resistance protein-like MFS transporter
MLALGVAGVGSFVWRQLRLQRQDRPLLDLRTLKLRVFSLSMAAMAVAFMGMLGSMILLQLYLQNVRGMSPLSTGLLVAPGGLAMGLLGPRVGRVYDRHGSRVLVIPGAFGLLAAMTAFTFVSATTPIALILVAHVVLMISLAALFTPLFTMGLGVLPPHLYSHGSSLLGTVQQVAGAMGTAAVVMVLSSRSASLLADGVAPVAATIGGMRWAFGVSAALCVVVLALVAMLPARISNPMEPAQGEDELVETV